jgi:hypothetical protein
MDNMNNGEPGESALFCYLIHHFNTFHTVDSKPVDTRYPEVSHGFPQLPQQISQQYLQQQYDQFPTNPFQFVLHLSSYHLTLHSLSYRQ